MDSGICRRFLAIQQLSAVFRRIIAATLCRHKIQCATDSTLMSATRKMKDLAYNKLAVHVKVHG
jgi:hypothetical protein